MRFIAWAAVTAALFISPANARCFEVVGRVMVERSTVDSAGLRQVVLTPTSAASPGDHLVFQFDYWKVQPYTANTLVMTNPVTPQLVYAGSDTPGELVSVDGGRTFGALAELTVTDVDGLVRAAMPDDVTHVRWVVKKEMPSGSGGQLAFRAVMRDVNYLPERDVQLAMR